MNSSVASAAQQPSAAESGVAEAATTPTTTASDGARAAPRERPAARAPASATQPLAAAQASDAAPVARAPKPGAATGSGTEARRSTARAPKPVTESFEPSHAASAVVPNAKSRTCFCGAGEAGGPDSGAAH